MRLGQISLFLMKLLAHLWPCVVAVILVLYKIM